MKTLVQQTQSLANYMPPGRVFAAKNIIGSISRFLLEGLAGELVRADSLVEEFKREILPDNTVLFIDEWESAVGIPDDCFNGQGDLATRRRDVLVKLVSLGVQTAADFVALAALFGITAVVKGGSTHGTFPHEFPMIFFESAKIARHTILIDLAGITTTFPYTFEFADAGPPEVLQGITFGNPEITIIKCLFAKLKPAHCDILYTDL